MRILLTNDDGIKSPGLFLLADALRSGGHRVFVVAPDTERSGMSHSVTFFANPCKLRPLGEDTWSCSGTPADCVVVALNGGLPQLSLAGGAPPDLVLSGINRGANLGTDVVYSGTAAAARQGSLMGIPSVALSLVEWAAGAASGTGSEWHWEPAVAFTMKKLEEMVGYWQKGTFVNVNFPNTQAGAADLVQASLCKRHYTDAIEPFTAPGGDIYCFARIGKSLCKDEEAAPAVLNDGEQVRGGNASLSVILSQPVAVFGV